MKQLLKESNIHTTNILRIQLDENSYKINDLTEALKSIIDSPHIGHRQICQFQYSRHFLITLSRD